MYYLRNIFITVIVCILFTTCSTTNSKVELIRSTPEAEGVSSEAIMDFIRSIEESDHEIHSFMFLRHGKVIAEGWWDPYAPELKHTLYSLSKSFTSTAVGFAVTEKLLTVNDKVISFFPEYLPDTIAPFLSELTIKDLLTMSVGQYPAPSFATSLNDSNWVKVFLSEPIVNKPGSKFLYNSFATYMLSAIVQKVSGEKIIDYLTPRLFEPLGIKGMDWETCPLGINTGGWGLRLKTEDIAKTGQMYLQKGLWNGTQLLPEEWIEEASTIKIEQEPLASQARKDSSDWLQGYCYQFWRCRNKAYRGDGAYGQFLLVMPDQDAVIAITAETNDMQAELNLVWEYLLPGINEGKLPPNDVATKKLKQKLSSLILPIDKNHITSPLVKDISGKRFLLESNEKNIEAISFNFNDNICKVSLEIDATTHNISFSDDLWLKGESSLPEPYLVPFRKLESLFPSKIAGKFVWKNETTLELTLRYIESTHSDIISCSFDKNSVSITIKNIFSRDSGPLEIKGKLE